jgi:hypothetical protein
MISTSSSDNSVVYYTEGKDYVSQIFKYKDEYNRVKHICLNLDNIFPVNVFIKEHLYTYDPMSFLSQMTSYQDSSRLIVWKRIHCLNQITDYKFIIKNNYYKFLWDIFKAITALHVMGYKHNDPTIDNIGIRDGNFVLYDYNLTRKLNVAQEDMENDFYSFFKSIRFHLQTEGAPRMFQPKSLTDLVHSLSKKLDYSLTQTIQYLDQMVIERIK